MTFIRWFMLAFLLVISSITAFAQPVAPLWYHHSGQNLIKNYGQFSEEVIPLVGADEGYLYSVGINRAGTLAAFCLLPYSTEAPRLVLFDLNTRSRRAEIFLEGASFCAVSEAGFTPDGRQVAVGYARYDFSSFTAPNQGWGLRLYDVNTLSMVRDFRDRTFAVEDTEFPYLPIVKANEGDNMVVTVYPIYFEGGFYEGQTFSLTVATGAIYPYLHVYNYANDSIHPLTGEIAYTVWMLGLPATDSYIPYMASNNVVVWDSGGWAQIVYTTSSYVIANVDFLPDASGLRVRMISNASDMDAMAFEYIETTIRRDGTFTPFVRISERDANSTLVWVSSSVAITASAPPAMQPVLCAGSLPPRFSFGDAGRVLPGPANNLRARPTVDSDRLDRMPANAEFVVLGGPFCDGTYAWWNVFYNGRIGWTAESDRERYFIEPIR
jgi:hypothetical protein